MTFRPDLSFGNPMPLAIGNFDQSPPAGNPRNYDITPDGNQFFVVRESMQLPSEAQPPQIVVVLSWLEELKQRIPANSGG